MSLPSRSSQYSGGERQIKPIKVYLLTEGPSPIPSSILQDEASEFNLWISVWRTLSHAVCDEGLSVIFSHCRFVTWHWLILGIRKDRADSRDNSDSSSSYYFHCWIILPDHWDSFSSGPTEFHRSWSFHLQWSLHLLKFILMLRNEEFIFF